MSHTSRNPIVVICLISFIIACNGPNSPVSDNGDKYRITYLGQDYHLFTLDDIYAPKTTAIETSGDIDPLIKWSPTANRIAYLSYFDDPIYSTGLFTIRPDGKDKKLLTPLGLINGGLTLGLAWSSDGRKLAYVSNVEPNIVGEQNIWIVDNDGNNPKKMTNDGFNVDPTWFPDSEHLAFRHFEDNHEDTTAASGFYHIINTVTNELLHNFRERSSPPVFSDDGKQIAVGFTTALKISMDFGKTFTQVLDDSSSGVFNVPIGFTSLDQRLLFASYLWFNRRTSQAEITVINLEGTDRKVLRQVENLAWATLSPDREKILISTWVQAPNGRWWLDLYILSVDGSEYFKLVEEVKSPSWGPVN